MNEHIHNSNEDFLKQNPMIMYLIENFIKSLERYCNIATSLHYEFKEDDSKAQTQKSQMLNICLSVTELRLNTRSLDVLFPHSLCSSLFRQ